MSSLSNTKSTLVTLITLLAVTATPQAVAQAAPSAVTLNTEQLTAAVQNLSAQNQRMVMAIGAYQKCMAAVRSPFGATALARGPNSPTGVPTTVPAKDWSRGHVEQVSCELNLANSFK
jgi:hypothetical protein